MSKIVVQSADLKDWVIGELSAKYSVDGTRVLRYYIDFQHKGLGLHKELSATDLGILQNKVDTLAGSWDRQMLGERKKQKLASDKEAAEQLTREAETAIASISRILERSLKVDDRIVWDALKDHSEFAGSAIFREPKPPRRRDPEPIYEDPQISFFDKLLGRRNSKFAAAKMRHAERVEKWRQLDEQYEKTFQRAAWDWEERKNAFQANYEADKAKFLEEKGKTNEKIDTLAAGVASGNVQAVIEHATMVLENSDYDGLFDKSFEVEYNEETRTLLIDYELPSPDRMPRTKSVKFISASKEMRQTLISEREQRANYDLACFQISLRTIHEVIEADEANNIDGVSFSGFVSSIDKATGKDVHACIMSVLIKKAEFQAIDLGRVDAKACFKSLKGVSASTLSALAPVPPIMPMDRTDRRFVEARSTVADIDDRTNLASMDWEDFEHLVRELFDKEFASRGGEVKVTQASSDGGVDAVAFDPDPISGGKIVIQAKRYTKTVGVSAVRDLYGTLLSEGASKGLLVTTADYGPDAHKFATGKPITLISGANLLHLLAKHGVNAKIDLREARKEMNLRAVR